jgi:hypothetical protein
MYPYGISSCLLVPVGTNVRDETMEHFLPPSFYILGENSIKTDFSSELSTLENTVQSTYINLVT